MVSLEYLEDKGNSLSIKGKLVILVIQLSSQLDKPPTPGRQNQGELERPWTIKQGELERKVGYIGDSN